MKKSLHILQICKNSFIVFWFDKLACDDLFSQLQLTIHAYEWSWFHRLDRMYYKLDHQSHLVTWCCSGLVSPYPVRYGWPKRLRPLQRHYLSFYIKYYTCLSGSFGVTCLKQLTMHLAIHLDAEPYDCTICGKSFSWADCIKTHIPRPWMMVRTTAVSVESASAGRATSKLIFPAWSQEESMARKYAFCTLKFFSNRMGVYSLQRYIHC